jgi:hypothetical protein
MLSSPAAEFRFLGLHPGVNSVALKKIFLRIRDVYLFQLGSRLKRFRIKEFKYF